MVATSGRGWRLAPSLGLLVDECDARWPGRDRSSDGSIGDQSHAARSSEHNPDHDSDLMPTGLVSAVDITKDSPAQIEELRRKLIADPRTWYVIHDGFMYSRTRGFKKQTYHGSNPHRHHLHVSLMQTATAANDVHTWGIARCAKPVVLVGRKPGMRTLRQGATGRDVAFLQRWLGVTADGDFGEETTAAVRRYQRKRGLAADGVVGPKTWNPILRSD